MEQKPKVRIYDNGFTPYVKSASLREENKDVSPTYFEWDKHCGNMDDGIFITDGQLRTQNGYGKGVIAWLIEPRELRPENYNAAAIKHDLYKNVLTYDKKLLYECPNALFYPLGGSSIAFDKWKIYPKTKDICMILSDKKTTEGHKLRHKIAEELGDRIDLYGAGVGKPFDSKFEILKDYRYCIVVESCDIDYYWTEKLIDCLSVGTIPIYNGTPVTFNNLFDRNGFCAFYEIKELTRIIDSLEDSKKRNHILFESCEVAREYNLKEAKNYRVCEDWIYTKYPELLS